MMDSIGPKNDSQSESQLAALIQQASHYDYTKELKIGMYVDAKDTAQTWRMARILNQAPTGITAHYEGWSQKHDEVK